MIDPIVLRNEKAYLNGQKAEEIAKDLFDITLSNGLVDGWINGKPVEIKACQMWQSNGAGRCRGRFVLERDQHEYLVKNGGYYLFIVFTEDGVISKLIEAEKVPFKRKLSWPSVLEELIGDA